MINSLIMNNQQVKWMALSWVETKRNPTDRTTINSSSFRLKVGVT